MIHITHPEKLSGVECTGSHDGERARAPNSDMDPIDPHLQQWITRWIAQWVAQQPADSKPSHQFHIATLNVEASHRRFYRITYNNARNTNVVMSSPPALENNHRFEVLASVFGRFGVAVPRILASNPATGWFLMSDLGTQHLEDVYGSPQVDAAMALAVKTLIKIQRIDDGALERYTLQRFREELGIFRNWFVETWLQLDFPTNELASVFEHLVMNTEHQHQCCVHRDFHCRNLLVQQDDLGVVDFQDALVGPISYDVASLLRDCYHRFSEAEINHWRANYLRHSELPVDAEVFAADVDLMAVQRQLKAVGIFARLQLRDGKTSHLRYIPSVLQHIDDVSRRYPQLQPLCTHLGAWHAASIQKLATSDPPSSNQNASA